MRAGSTVAVGSLVLAAVLVGSSAPASQDVTRLSARSSSAEQGPGETTLDVPYVPQREALCGGAAVAMVLRYWGEPMVQAQDFAGLVEKDGSGIRTTALVDAVAARGYLVLPFTGSHAAIEHHLAQRRPLIALIADRPGRNHYVVIVGVSPGRIIIHDPAGIPFELVQERAFEAKWRAADHWALLILPDQSTRAESPRDEGLNDPARVHADPCAAQVEEAVRHADSGDLDRADALLTASAKQCPDSPAAWRELGGVRFLQKRWNDAARLAERAVALDPNDAYAWQLLATSRFLLDDLGAALQAWNRRQEPRVDLTRIKGLAHIRYRVVSDLVHLPPDTLLTDAKLRLAERRLHALPALLASRVAYEPIADRRATVDVSIVERPVVGTDVPSLMGLSLHALTDREISTRVASPTRGGEAVTASWRWWAMRPRAALSLAVPRLLGLPGIWTLGGSWERQSYDLRSEAAGASTFQAGDREERRSAALSVSDWFSADLRWQLTTRLDRWQGRGSFVSVEGELERRLADDRLALRGGAGWWTGLGGRLPFGRGSVASAWRSSTRRDGPTWTARAGLEATAGGAPLDLWPGAGIGQGRSPLLRAHALLDAGVIRGKAFGPVLATGGIEFQTWIRRSRLVRVGWAVFTDVAKPWTRPAAAEPVPLLIDAGVGLRIDLPGSAGRLRLDVARGVRDGSVAASAGWALPWPAWP